MILPDWLTPGHWIGFHDKGIEGVYVVVVEVLTGGYIRIGMATIVPTTNECIFISIGDMDGPVSLIVIGSTINLES